MLQSAPYLGLLAASEHKALVQAAQAGANHVAAGRGARHAGRKAGAGQDGQAELGGRGPQVPQVQLPARQAQLRAWRARVGGGRAGGQAG